MMEVFSCIKDHVICVRQQPFNLTGRRSYQGLKNSVQVTLGLYFNVKSYFICYSSRGFAIIDSNLYI